MASWYGGATVLKMALLKESLDSLFFFVYFYFVWLPFTDQSIEKYYIRRVTTTNT